jgi:glycine cleavage system H lipoate-binding protein
MVTLVFVAVLLAVVALDVWLIHPWERKHSRYAPRHAGAPLELVVPRNLFFHPGHTWARLDADGLITVGIDDLAQTLAGEPLEFEPPVVGSSVTAGQPAFGIGSQERRLRLAAPVSGTVAKVNPEFGKDPVRLRWQPYKEGWMFRVAPGDRLSAELQAMAIGRDAELWMRSELDRLDRLFDQGVLGPAVVGALQNSGTDTRALIEREIFRVENHRQERVS